MIQEATNEDTMSVKVPVSLPKLSAQEIASFQKIIYDFYNEQGRDFAWRNIDNPYWVVVSEIMLQQTQTDRVKKKYEEFIATFPTIESLAESSLDKVIAVWQGLGYNRRALALRAFAQRIVAEYKGTIPHDPELLVSFRGIGPATAASICAFSFNTPTVFIETNIRSVFIHHFFPQGQPVHDKALIPLVAQTLDFTQPRIWYYALMDYGVMLKKQHNNPSRKSVHHTKQSKFKGSDREVRGAILKMLVTTATLSKDSFVAQIDRDQKKIESILQDLEQEGFIRQSNGHYALTQ
jgi:A/G-specific adenine glycosylase